MTAVAATTGTVDERIGALVHQLMWENRITQKAMADLLGIQQSAMSRKLRGGRPWLAAEVATVAHALGVPPGDLMPTSPPSIPFPASPATSGDDESTTRRSSTGELNPVVVRPLFGDGSRPAVVPACTTAVRDRMSA